ncbi:hypothetical protein FACS18942_04950 [Planctomycetales bacterium]|nr:hypothetical protein FACS18942_04950 [Planctomycetales bacterium]GHT33800.1 hypothetical protein FACS189427_00010 [Planctomycetales bacterium]
MATIASLAIKVSANIADLSKGINSINSSIGYMVKTAKNASPSLKSLEDVAKGAGAVMDAVAAAQKRVNDNPVDLESQMILTKTQEAAEKLKTELNRIGSGVSGDILKMTSTISNLQKAQQMVQQLKDTFGETSPIVQQAQANVGKLAADAGKAKMQMEGLKTVIFAINNAPFMLLGSIFKDMWQEITNLGSDFNKYFNGMPGVILKVSAVIASLIVLIGLMNTQMLTLNGSVTYFRSLWAGSIIAQGLQGFITMLNTMLGTQLALNAATMLWIGMFTLGIAAAVAAVYLLYQRWTDTSDAIAQSESRVAALTDRMEEVVAAAKKINDSMVQSLNEMMTPLDKYKQKLDEIKAASGQKFTLALDMKDVSFEMQDIAAKMSKTKDESALEAYSGQISELQKQFKALKEQQKIAAGFSDADITAAKAKALEDYRSSLGIVKTDAELLAEQTRKLTDGLAAGTITQNEFNSLMQSAKEKYDPATKAQIQAEQDYIAAIEKADEEMRKTLEAAENARKQLLDKEIQAREQLIDKFRQMANDSPVAKFLELKEQLESVRDSLSRTDFSAAMDKLQSDLAGGLGIKEFLMPEQSPAEKLADIYKKLEAYADKINDPFFDLAAAKQRAADKLMPKEKEKEKEPDKESPEASSQNQAAVKGTLAYFEAQNKANQPMLTESKKQTAALTIIAGNTKPKPAETPFEIQAV